MALQLVHRQAGVLLQGQIRVSTGRARRGAPPTLNVSTTSACSTSSTQVPPVTNAATYKVQGLLVCVLIVVHGGVALGVRVGRPSSCCCAVRSDDAAPIYLHPRRATRHLLERLDCSGM